MKFPANSVSAQVVLITRSAKMLSLVSSWLADERTTLTTCQSLTALQVGPRPDLIVLDRTSLTEPFAELRRLRRRWPTVEVAVLGALNDDDVTCLLDAGADDASVTPSRLARPRLQAMARRARTHNASLRIAIGDVVFDRESRRIWCGGVEINLTPTEQALLDCLFWHSPTTISVDALADFVWGRSSPAHRSLARVYVGYLRTKLKTSRKTEIRTVRGHGYELVAVLR